MKKNIITHTLLFIITFFIIACDKEVNPIVVNEPNPIEIRVYR